MDEELKAYIDKLPIKKGKLAPWEYAMFELRKVGATLQQIVDFLNTKGVTAHLSEVQRFMNRKKRGQRFATGTAPRTRKIENRDQTDNAIPEAIAQSKPRPVSSEKPKSVKNNEVLKQSAKPEKADEANPPSVAGNQESTAKPKGLPKFTWNIEEERKKPILW